MSCLMCLVRQTTDLRNALQLRNHLLLQHVAKSVPVKTTASGGQGSSSVGPKHTLFRHVAETTNRGPAVSVCRARDLLWPRAVRVGYAVDVEHELQ